MTEPPFRCETCSGEGPMSAPLEDYALIGDCESAALVGIDGSIDWLCWPRFDRPACFAALLGTPDNGRWRIAPLGGEAEVSRRYDGDTLILETTYETDTGAVVLIDFMPVHDEYPSLVRIVRGLRGHVEMRSELVLRFEYGLVVPWVTEVNRRVHRAVAGPDRVAILSDVTMHGEGLTTVGNFTVRAGDSCPFVLAWSPSHTDPRSVERNVGRTLDESVPRALARTKSFWKKWASRCTYRGDHRKQVMRSLLTLKALTYAPTGGIVAAPTMSLPEHIGGVRNWDYRYCWLRDATLTLLALVSGGYTEEAGQWRDWLLRAAMGSPDQVQIMYGLSGERSLHEHELEWLPGYEGSAPVRVGNAAHAQMQLDVYGEVMDALHQASVAGLATSDDAWSLQRKFTAHIGKIWREPDAGIWEVRGKPQHFTHSKVMAWVAVDRAIRSAEQFGLRAPLEDWRALRDEIHVDVCERAFSKKAGCFAQAYDSDLPDASTLIIPLVGFLPPDDPRVIATIRCVEQHLCVNGFVLRYNSRDTDDGLPEGEGAFLACSFWLADCYVLMGRRDDAEKLFNRLVSLCNDVGLLSEEYDPALGRLCGNFPQGFSHLALLSTAFNLWKSNGEAMVGKRAR